MRPNRKLSAEAIRARIQAAIEKAKRESVPGSIVDVCLDIIWGDVDRLYNVLT